MTKVAQNLSFIYTTFPTHAEALSVATKLLELKLIACANVIAGATSLYHWEGKLHEENEVVMMAKTTDKLRQKALDTLVSLHSYDIPCALSIPITDANPAFAQWVSEQVSIE